MPARRIKFGSEARAGCLRGADVLARAVGITLGPKGRYVALDRDYGTRISRDGVSVARMIELSDRFADAGASLMRELTVKTSDDTGDGTTTATVLARAIVSEGARAVVAGINPMDIRRGIHVAVAAVVGELRGRSRTIATVEEIASIATVASNDDSDIGHVVAEAMDAVGREGAITVEEGNALETELEIVEGLRFDRGYVSHHLVTDTRSMICELADPLVLVCEKKLSSFEPLVSLLEDVLQSERPFLVIAEGIEGEALGALVVNKQRGGMETMAVEGPSFGDHRKALLEDIAVVTGAQIISEDLGLKLENARLEMLGSARRAIITATTTTLVECAGDPGDIGERCDLIRAQIRANSSDTEENRLRERLARLAGGIAVIRVGGASELEIKERRDRFDCALRSARAALEEGVLPGGGVALLHASRVLDEVSGGNADQNAGIEIVRRALREPARRIADNAGYDGSLVVGTLLNRQHSTLGFDVRDGSYVDMVEAGIIDSTKVIRSALQNAASVSALLVTTEAVVAQISDA